MSTQDVILSEAKGDMTETMTQTYSESQSKAREGADFEKKISTEQNLSFSKNPLTDDEMKELGLVNEDGVYTNLGLLFSEQCPVGIRVVVYDGVNRDSIKSVAEFGGPVYRQILDAVEFAPGDWGRLLKDAIINAVIRRNFTYGGHMPVRIFDDRIEIMSMGYLADNFEGIRNEALYAALRRIKLGAQKNKHDFFATRGAFMLAIKKEEAPAKRLLDFIREQGSVSRKDAEAFLGLKQTAAGKVLKELQDSGEISVTGSGKLTKYVASQQ